MNDTRERRVATLSGAAKKKSQIIMTAADTTTRALVKSCEPIIFPAVQREAGVSHAFLYKHSELRQRIEQLRGQQGITGASGRRADREN